MFHGVFSPTSQASQVSQASQALQLEVVAGGAPGLEAAEAAPRDDGLKPLRVIGDQWPYSIFDGTSLD